MRANDLTFIHFTTAEGAAAIVASGVLELSRTIVHAVYAAVAGGANVPGVQYSRDPEGSEYGDGSGAVVAVVFSTPLRPDSMFPEECIWHRTEPLPIVDAFIVDAETARESLDDSLGIPEDGWHWEGGHNCWRLGCTG